MMKLSLGFIVSNITTYLLVECIYNINYWNASEYPLIVHFVNNYLMYTNIPL